MSVWNDLLLGTLKAGGCACDTTGKKYEEDRKKGNKAPAGGGGGVVDWDDIQNKPLDRQEIDVELLPEQVVTFAEEYGTLAAEIETVATETDGVGTVIVVFDGETYECAWNGIFGNLAIWGEGNDTGEPFVGEYFGNGKLYLYISAPALPVNEESGANAYEHTVSVRLISAKTKKLPVEYIPKEELPQIMFVTADADGNTDVPRGAVNQAWEKGVLIFLRFPCSTGQMCVIPCDAGEEDVSFSGWVMENAIRVFYSFSMGYPNTITRKYLEYIHLKSSNGVYKVSVYNGQINCTLLSDV